jgi:FtsP/CotA-like multicopper oxidase with cupredoxin domain
VALAAAALMAAGAALAQAGPETVPTRPAPFRELAMTPSPTNVVDVTLKLAFGEYQIGADKVHLRTYNGKLVSDPLVVKPGDTLRVRLENALDCPKGATCTCKPDPCADGKESPAAHVHGALAGAPPANIFNSTNLHTHGLHVSPRCHSDNVFVDVEPGCGFSYEFKIPADHPAGTYWYHPHVHGATAIQVSSGAEGALIVKGAFDEVPGIRGAKDEILLFQQIPYKCDFQTAANWACKPGQVGLVQDFAQQFGPGKWDASKRYTTINGVVQPAITLRPEEVRRWRLIHGGLREKVVVAVGRKAGAAFTVEKGWLHLIALDGLPTGDVRQKDRVELDPGYRADVMIRAPKEPGTYYLLDEPSTRLLAPLNAAQRAEETPLEPLKVLAVIKVEGKPCSDPQNPCHRDLPRPEQLAGFRLPSITDAEIAGRQPQKVYFDIKNGAFTVCGKAYDPKAEPRRLEFGKADEWVVASSTVAGHPFHIHVNPFEVIDETTGERYWKDTLFVDKGKTVKVRMRYETFDGDFVLHCHILDHEDQGMMETVRIAPGPQPVEACPPLNKVP